MPRVIVTAEVEDGIKWEAAFRTHEEVLRTYGLKAPVETLAPYTRKVCLVPIVR